jgi:hypothetical protein
MSDSYAFRFKGGVVQPQAGASVKFLMFLVNGGKEISFFEAKKVGLVDVPALDSIRDFAQHSYTTNCGIVKVFMLEQTFGTKRIMQSFYLSLGQKMDRQEVTIQPINTIARAHGFMFHADATFLKRREVLSIIDEKSVAAKMLCGQESLSADVLRQMITIKKFVPPKEPEYMVHGKARFLRIIK